MGIRNFLKVGHWPTLLGAFLYFDVSFMVWVLIGALGIFMATDFDLNPSAKGLLVALPLLGGSLLRLPFGMLTDRIGSRKTALGGMALTVLPLLWATLRGETLLEVYSIGLLLGIAGASFAVALPMASRWYPPSHQGLVLGLAGAGNSGTVLAALFAPRLAQSVGWHTVFGLALLPLALVMGYVYRFCRDSPSQPPPVSWRHYLLSLREHDALLFCLFYMITFGGFVGLASFLPIFFYDQYSVSRVVAGNLTAVCVFAGSLCRPLGGYIADRLGGIRTLSLLYAAIALCLFPLATPPSLPATVPLLFVAMLLMGMGNGAIFQLVPQRFPQRIGTLTGLIGSFGGLGGFLLPPTMGLFKERFGSYGLGFLLFGVICLITLLTLRAVQVRWRTRWELAEGGLL